VTDGPAVPEGWELVDGALRRELRFADFAEAFAFMTEVAAEAERLDHHPDWSNSWNRVVIELRSHDVGGITERDLALAGAIDAIVGDRAIGVPGSGEAPGPR
jgi:4a-hydroxytetrahydrobiopterin dehydratase